MSDERMEQNRQPEKTDVVFFSPEMLRLADQHGGSSRSGWRTAARRPRTAIAPQRCRWDCIIFTAPAA